MDSATVIFCVCFIFSWVVFIWEFYLSIRQFLKHRDTVERPDDLRDVIDEETFRKARLYKLDKARFGFAADIWGQLEDTAVLIFGLIPFFWNLSGNVIASWGLSHEIWHSLVFTIIATIINKMINLPWQLYYTFVIEERHGFNKQTLGFFIRDQIKALLVGFVIGSPIIAAVIWIIRWGGDYFFVFVWAFISVVIFFLMTIYPEFIAPLFDKYEPLPEGELRTKIEALAARLHFPLKKLFVVEGSKRSAHSNAYMYGLWNNKRIVLYDTLVANYSPLNRDKNEKTDDQTKNAEPDSGAAASDDQKQAALKDDASSEKKPAEKKSLGMSDDEVVAVIGHELGHWQLNHNTFNILFVEVNMFLCLAVFASLYKLPSLYAAFGFTDSQPVVIGMLIIFEFIFAPYNELTNFVQMMWTRHMEFAADAFSTKLGYARLMISALIKLEKDNLSFPVDDWLYSAWHYSHPPVPERIDAIKKHE